VQINGKLRRVYSVESPESWFEDFGTAQLSGGQATISLEPGFAAIVHADSYHVFLTARGDSAGLYVADQSSSGFTVREQQSGKSSVGFTYRIVAKRMDIRRSAARGCPDTAILLSTSRARCPSEAASAHSAPSADSTNGNSTTAAHPIRQRRRLKPEIRKAADAISRPLRAIQVDGAFMQRV
jgi:hypothetical protein